MKPLLCDKGEAFMVLHMTDFSYQKPHTVIGLFIHLRTWLLSLLTYSELGRVSW